MKRSEKIHREASFLGDVVFSASDGIVTTFAIVAGAIGASFSASIVLILGFANLFADGFSMAAGNFLGVKSKMDFERAKGNHESRKDSPLAHGLVTFVAFNTAGFLPLAPFVFNIGDPFRLSTIFVVLAMFGVGVSRSFFTKKPWYVSGFEMLFVGGFAALVAFTAGFLIESYVV
jgi:vacuolar iron transporter family protein